ncbi:MAG: hypothetical protein N2661_08855 [Anoxybacillus mongoliensis]|nr:hypothetical protein [Anoxybacillus mongoliensis]
MGTLLQKTMKQKQFYIDQLNKGGETDVRLLHHWTVSELRRKYEQLRKEIKK